MSILQHEQNKTLRKIAREIPISKITSKPIQKILSDMKRALDKEYDGVALAAPQIGQSLRIFIVSPHAFAKYTDQNLIYINPKILKTSKTKHWLEEGCLSVRWYYGETHRYDKVLLEAYNEHGEKFTYGGSGLLAQIFQHETDHLDGKLFIDSGRNVRRLSEEEIEKQKELAKNYENK